MRLNEIQQARGILRQLADPTCLDWVSDGSNAPSKAVNGVPVRVERGAQGKARREVLVIVVQTGKGERRVNWRIPQAVLSMVLKSASLAILERSEVLEYCQAEHCNSLGFLPWGSLGRKGDWKEGSGEDIARHQAKRVNGLGRVEREGAAQCTE